MSKIRILSEILSNKIAAGEVVQRPSSAVKELIENSIDAESRKITIEIKKGGMALIRVSDNGIGMNKDDALLSLERYATSKIRNDNDLFSIKTLGFRGEAIPSISSISKFSIITRENHDYISTKIEVIGSKIKNVSDCGSPQGTIVTVKDLFFNVPVRRKILKSAKLETKHILDVVASMAISRPEIRFKLVNNGKVTKDLLNVNDPMNRINDVLGQDTAECLLPFQLKSDSVAIKGWIGSQKISRSTSKGIFFFINGRHIKSPPMYQGVISAYQGRMVKGRYPIVIIFIDLAYDQVDVNVHPTKREVQFFNQRQVCDLLYSLVYQNLKKLDYLKWQHPTFLQTCNNKGLRENMHIESSYRCENYTEAGLLKLKELKHGSNSQSALWGGKDFFSDLKIIGQHYNAYIICSIGGTLILIDQHAAHERILFEELKANVKRKTPLFQGLLSTELIETNFIEGKILKKLIPYLDNCGLKIKSFGGNTFTVEAIPAPLDGNEISVSGLIGKLIKILKDSNVGIHKYKKKQTRNTKKDITHECLTIMSCYSAIKSGHTLKKQQIKTLIRNLGACDNSSYCPHGRPTWARLELSDLEKKFSRR